LRRAVKGSAIDENDEKITRHPLINWYWKSGYSFSLTGNWSYLTLSYNMTQKYYFGMTKLTLH